MVWAEHAVPTEEMRKSHRTLIGKPEGKMPYGIPKFRWLEKIKWIFKS
jgi:hypothetical protein